MAISRALARPMLSAIFIRGGIEAIRNPEGKVKAADPVVQPLVRRVPALPQDTETMVRVNGAVMVLAGSLLALGKLRRLAALALIGSVLPTTYAGHRFWEETDEAKRAQQLVHFLKNIGLVGGLILAAVDTEGAPSLSWRARRALRARAKPTAQVSQTLGQLGQVAGQVSHLAEHLGQAAGHAVELTAHTAGQVALSAGGAAHGASQAAAQALGQAAQNVGQTAGPVAKDLRRAARRAAKKAAGNTRPATKDVRRAARRAAKKARAAAKRLPV